MSTDFKVLAEELKRRVRSVDGGPNTEVMLITHCTDLDGNAVQSIRASIVPTTKVRFPKNPEGAKQFAEESHRDTILANIDSMVASTPDQPVRMRDGPPFAVKIVGYDLEIFEPTST